MTDSVRAICFPRDDDAFVARVQFLIGAQAPPDERLRAAIEATLRESYPLAVVSARHALATLDGHPTWYVYRDGTALAHAQGESVAPSH
jgi:hypothetical protein